MWLNELKVAVVTRDTALLGRLLEDVPQLEKREEIEQAVYLLKEASSFMQSLKDEAASSMLQMRKNIDFLSSTQRDKQNSLDVTS